jgi:DNA-binding NarL/FixJ family response regulator
MSRIVLADDHSVMRQGLRALLQMEAGFTIVGEASDGNTAVELVEQLKPDVLVVDLVMPGLGGLDVLREVRRRSPATRVVVLSMHANEAYVQEALQNGASGYVLKDSEATDLIQAIRQVVAGRRYLSAAISERAIHAYSRKAGTGTLDLYETLTNREREVLRMVAEGRTSPEIAERLYIGVRTAETHRANLMRKLGLRSQADVIRFALRRGLIALDEGAPVSRDDEQE